jgi:hypothetical protein
MVEYAKAEPLLQEALRIRGKVLGSENPETATDLGGLFADKSQYASGWRLVKIEVGQDGELSFCLRKDKLREIRQREGRYLFRSNLGSENPAQLWQLYVLLIAVPAFVPYVREIRAVQSL